MVCAAKAGVQSLLLQSGCCDDARNNLLLCLHTFARYQAAMKDARSKIDLRKQNGFYRRIPRNARAHRHRRAYVNGVGPSFLSSETLVIKTHCVEVEEFRAATTSQSLSQIDTTVSYTESSPPYVRIERTLKDSLEFKDS